MKNMFKREIMISVAFCLLSFIAIVAIQMIGSGDVKAEWGRSAIFGIVMGIVAFIGMFSLDKIKRIPEMNGGGRTFKQKIIDNAVMGIIWGVTIFISQIITQYIGGNEISILRAGIIGISFMIIEFVSFTIIDKIDKNKKEKASS